VPSAQRKPLIQSVVKVLTVSDAPDYAQPWQMLGPAPSSGSGAIIQTERGLRVLTNAHVVQNQVFVELRRFDASHKFVATVEGVSHECDLALLKVRKQEFFAGAKPIELGTLPDLGDQVTVCGYPVGGDRLSLTRGVVSRIEVCPYAHSQRQLLAVQIDAAVNSGNSGGPVFQEDRLIGVAFQSLDETQNIAYAVSLPVIEHFLADLAAKRRPAFPGLGIYWQRLESASHRRALGLKPASGGVLVLRVAFRSSAWGFLEPGDVVMAIDGEQIGPDGTVALRTGELVDFSCRVDLRHIGDPVRLTVMRNKRVLDVELTLAELPLLVPEDSYDVRPTYFIFGGLVFAPLTRDYLKSWGHEWWKTAPRDLMSLYETCMRTPERQEVVVLQKVLADKVNQGYHEYGSFVVTHIDGVSVASLAQLVGLVEQGTEPFLTVQIHDGQRLVLDRAKARERSREILERFGVPADRSSDLVPTRKRRGASRG
jgi:S1-C subfamily serine protease